MRAALANFFTLARGRLAALDAARRSEAAVTLRAGAPVGVLTRVVLFYYHRDDRVCSA